MLYATQYIPADTSPGWVLTITVVVLLNDLSGLVGVVKTVHASGGH